MIKRQIKKIGAKADKFTHLAHHLSFHHHKSQEPVPENDTNYKLITDKNLEGESDVDMKAWIDSLNLIDHDADLDDQKERENDSALLKESMYYALITLFLPIHTVPEDFSKPITPSVKSHHHHHEQQSQTTYKSMSLEQLKEQVVKLFDGVLTSEDMEKIWKKLFQEDASDGMSDLSVNFLLLRKIMLQKQKHLPYQVTDFKIPEKYETWRNNKIKEIDLILASIKAARKTHFSCKLEVEFGESSFEKKHVLEKANEADIFYKVTTNHPETTIKVNKEKKAENSFESSSVESKLHHNETAFHPVFKDLMKFTMQHSSQDITFDFIYSKYNGIKKKEIGKVEIHSKDLVGRLFPLTNWGIIETPVTLEFPVMSVQNEKIGFIQLKFTGSYQKFPVYEGNWDNYISSTVKKLEKTIDTAQFPDIYEVKRVLLRRSFLAPKSDNSLVSPVHKWILGEIDLLFGLSNHNAEITLLDIFSKNVRFMVSFVDQFQKSYEEATILVGDNLKQTAKINSIMERVEKKVTDTILNFKERLPRNKPDGVLENVIEVYDFILTKTKKLSYEEYTKKLDELVDQAIALDYDLIKKQQMEVCKTETLNANTLISMIPLITYKIDRLYDFSSTFPTDVKYEPKNWAYYEMFKKDFQNIESAGGFSGYQMLHFCGKLKALSEVIENTEDLKDKKSELLDGNIISKGYEEKFIEELYKKLSSCAQQAILIDNWLVVNDSVKHSTSVVDFYTTASETWEYVSHLEFFDEHLLSMFTEMLGKVTLEYANQIKNMAVSVISKNTTLSTTIGGNVPSGKNSKVLSLFKSKKSSAEEKEKKEEETYTEVTITADFLVMLNDIEASKIELETILDSITQRDQDLRDEKEVEKKLEEHESTEEDCDIDMENDQQMEEAEKKFDNIGEAQQTELEKSRHAIHLIIESLIAIIATSFRVPIRATLQKIMYSTKQKLDSLKGVTRPMPKKDVLDMFQAEADQILSSELIDPIFTPAFELLSANCYNQLFVGLLETVLEIIVSEVLYTFLLPVENYDVEKDKDKFLSIEQVYVLESCQTGFGVYLTGNDDDPDTGLPDEILERKSRLVKRLFVLYDYDYARLVNIYQKYEKHPQLNFSNVLKKHHILSLLKNKGDKESIAFYKAHQKEAEQQRLIYVFNLKPVQGADDEDESNDQYEDVVLSMPCTYEMSPYDVHMTELRLLLESKYSRKTKEFLLRDLTNVKTTKSLLSTKGIQFLVKGEETRRTITFSDSSKSSEFIRTLSQQLTKIGNDQSLLKEDLKSPSTPSTAGSKGIDESIFEKSAEALKSKFKITNPNSKLVNRHACKVIDKTIKGVLKEYLFGELLIFNNCICFHCGSDGVKSTYSVKINFNIIENIALLIKKDNKTEKIKVTTSLGYSASFFQVDDFISCIKDLNQQFDQWKQETNIDATLLEKLKKGDDKTYFISRFKLKNIGESDEDFERKIASSSAKTESGSLFIGNYHLCYESKNYLPSYGPVKEYEVVVTPYAYVAKIEKFIQSKLLVITLGSGNVICYMFDEEKLLEMAYQRVNVKVESLKPKMHLSTSLSNLINMSAPQPSSVGNFYLSPILKCKPETDSADNHLLASAQAAKQLQEFKPAFSAGSSSGFMQTFSALSSGIKLNIFGSKKL